MANGSIEVFLLGAAQDAGLPQPGCDCENCLAAGLDHDKAEFPSSIAVIDHTAESFWIIDATPALPEQLHLLRRSTKGYKLKGIFLTHAHIGHYTGLIYFGREAMSSKNMPVYASDRMCSFLLENEPWSMLVSLGTVTPVPIDENQTVNITPAVSVQPFEVPHRSEFTDTHAFTIRGPSRSLFYCPDTDSWETWSTDILSFVRDIDHALLDGTFYSSGEISQVRMDEVPHPLVERTVEKLQVVSSKITFIHMNHSNPIYRDGIERKRLFDQGFGIGKKGRKWDLG
jgi:pyrroloquinoline quinone biosynthesis protein B